MSANKNQNRIIGVILQYSQMLASILISLIYTPVMIKILGTSQYGLYNLANSIISNLSLLSLGFSASYIRYFSKYKTANNHTGLSKLNGLYLIFFTCLAIVSAVVGVFVSNNAALFLNNTYSEDDKRIAYVLMLIMSLNLSITFIDSVFASYVTAQEKFIFQKLLNILKTVLGPFMAIPLLLLGYGSIGMVVVSTAITLTSFFINIGFCLKKLEMKFSFKHMDWFVFLDIAKFSIFIAINQIIDQINWSLDKVILGKLCTSSIVAYYGIGSQINTYFINFSSSISHVFIPKIHEIENYDGSEIQKNIRHTNLFIKIGRIQFFILALILSGFIFYGQYFIYCWAGEDFTSSYYVALLLMCPAFIPLIQNIGIEIQRAKNKHHFRSYVYLIMSIFNAIISIFLAKRYNEIGVAIGTTLSLLFANGLIMNIFYQKVIGINIIQFWKEILKMFKGLFIPSFYGFFFGFYIPITSKFSFISRILIYICLYGLSMYLCALNSSEKAWLKQVMNKKSR